MRSDHAGWIRKVHILQQDVILISVHLERHRCLATVCPKEKAIRYYDSLGGRNLELLNRQKGFMKAESQDKKKTQLDTSSWKLECGRVSFRFPHPQICLHFKITKLRETFFGNEKFLVFFAFMFAF